MARTRKKAAQPVNPFPEIPDPFGYGQRAVDYLRSLKHPLSTLPDNAFQLDPWVERIIRRIYGPRHPNGDRIVKRAILVVPRGNRKTTLAGALVMLHGKGPERKQGGQLLSVASDKNQAKLTFNEVAGMIDPDFAFMPNIGNAAKTLDLKRGAKIRSTLSTITFLGSIAYEALASDAGTAQGRTPSLVIADELHAWTKRNPRELWAAMKLGAGKVKNSLMVVTTTAGIGQDNLAYDVISDARKIARGEIDDPATLAIIYEASPDDDWRDEKVWYAANPGLEHGYPDLETLRQEAREAERMPAERAKFQRYRLNIWQDASETPFVDMETYDKGNAPFSLSQMEGEPCWLGVDLSAVSDLTVIVAAWRDGSGGYFVYPWFFCPADNLQRRSDESGVPYTAWAEDGFIIATPGNAVDYAYVRAKIFDLCERFDVREIVFDRWGAQETKNILLERDLPVIDFGQGYQTMSPAISELERAILAGKFRHGGHPILRWNFANIAVEMDDAGNKKFSKRKSKDKIDGAVAAAMAVARAATGEDNRSVYDTDERPEGLLVW